MDRRVSFKPMYKIFKWEGVDGKPEKSRRENNNNIQTNMQNKPGNYPLDNGNIEHQLIKKHEQDFNDKELCIQRLSRRENVKNIKLNPYLDNSNYIEDISNQEKFLRPQYSSYQKNSNNSLIGERDMIKQRQNNPYITGDILKDLSDRKTNKYEYVKNHENKYLKKD